MWQRIVNWHPDPLTVSIVAAAILAIIFPASGTIAEAFGQATRTAIGFLFFLYNARLSPQNALAGVKHWRLHTTILAFIFTLFPISGLLMKPLGWILSPGPYLDILYLTLVLSMVQSSVNPISIAKGNIASAIVGASASNLLGVVVTPILVILLMATGSGVHVNSPVFLDTSLQLLLPFIIGQLICRWTLKLTITKTAENVDHLSIVMVIYATLPEGVVQGIWSEVSIGDTVVLILLSIVLTEFVLRLSEFIANKIGFDRKDRIAIQFYGSKKFLVTGLPVAAAIFDANASLYTLPLMTPHQTQLIICAVYTARQSKEAEAEPERQLAQRGRGHITGTRS